MPGAQYCACVWRVRVCVCFTEAARTDRIGVYRSAWGMQWQRGVCKVFGDLGTVKHQMYCCFLVIDAALALGLRLLGVSIRDHGGM